MKRHPRVVWNKGRGEFEWLPPVWRWRSEVGSYLVAIFGLSLIGSSEAFVKFVVLAVYLAPCLAFALRYTYLQTVTKWRLK